MLGDIFGSKEIEKAIKRGIDLTEIRDKLTQEEFDFNRLKQVG